MTAIREYPFDFSDLPNGQRERRAMPSTKSSDSKFSPSPKRCISTPNSERRKVSNGSRKHSRISNIERKISVNFGDPDIDKENVSSESKNGRISSHQLEGSSRRKSHLHNALSSDMDSTWDKQSHTEGRFKKYSTTSTIYSKKALSYQSDHIERSWWYVCCQKCHQEDSEIPSWEPPYWQKFCPYPFCPTFRKIARLVTIILIGIIVWLNLWLIMGPTAAPGGQLFMLAALVLASHLAGVLMLKVTTLPGLIGMILMGLLLKNIGFVNFDSNYQHVVTYIRKIALTILLIKAGMDLDPHAMKKHFVTVLKLSLIPWTFECVLSSVLVFYLLDLPWDWAFLLGSVVAAVSPAVIVSCLIRLRKKGYGASKGIPTLVLAVSGIDDAASVAVFGIVLSLIFRTTSITMTIVQGPLSIVIGIAFGFLLGYFLKFVPERNDAFLVPLRVVFLMFGGIFCMLGFEEIGWGGAGPLSVITFAFTVSKCWNELGWDIEDNPAVNVFEILWMFFEPMLFSVTGAQVLISELPLHLVLYAGAILGITTILRILLTSLCAVRSNLNMKEKIFVGLSWMAKATVQAALAPVALDHVKRVANGGTPDPDMIRYGEVVLVICILSIVITAPIGAIVISITGPRLLSRTNKPPILDGWRRSNRPSIRDISIIDEEEVAERDAERNEQTQHTEASGVSREISTPPIVTQPTNNHS